MHDELISVIVPAYNCAQWLPGTLDSLLTQTYSNLEIIVVNDGSKDETAEIIDRYTRMDSRIRGIHQENGGVTAARLRGVREAVGEWIGFADGDDILEPDMLRHLMENAMKYGADISHCGFSVHHPDNSVEYMHGTGALKVQSHVTGLQDLLAEALVEPSLCTKLFRRRLFRGLEEKMPRELKNNEDMLMNYYLFEQADTSVFEDICLYRYLLHPGSASRRKLNDHLIYDPIRVRQIILDHCEPDMREDARRALARMCLVSYRQLVVEPGREYRGDLKKVRSLIRQQLPHADMLPRRNRLLVHLISGAPWMFDCMFRVYACLTGKGKE